MSFGGVARNLAGIVVLSGFFLTFKALVISASIFSCLNNTVCVFEMRRKLCTLDMLKTCR